MAERLGIIDRMFARSEASRGMGPFTKLHVWAANALDAGHATVTNPVLAGLGGVAIGAIRGTALGIVLIVGMVMVPPLAALLTSGTVVVGIVGASTLIYSAVKGLKSYHRATLHDSGFGETTGDSIITHGGVAPEKLKQAKEEIAQANNPQAPAPVEKITPEEAALLAARSRAARQASFTQAYQQSLAAQEPHVMAK